jgi:coiled-coil domain-containing protein 55
MDLVPPAPVKLGFSLKQKPNTNTTVPQRRAASSFLSLDDDEPAKVGRTAPAPERLVATEASMSKSFRKQLEEQKKIDPHAFEYDEVWDQMKDAERQAQFKREEEAKIRKVMSCCSCAIDIILTST